MYIYNTTGFQRGGKKLLGNHSSKPIPANPFIIYAFVSFL